MLFIDKTPGQYLDTAEAILIIRSWYLISSHRKCSYQVTLVWWYKPRASMTYEVISGRQHRDCMMLAMTLSRYALVCDLLHQLDPDHLAVLPPSYIPNMSLHSGLLLLLNLQGLLLLYHPHLLQITSLPGLCNSAFQRTLKPCTPTSWIS